MSGFNLSALAVRERSVTLFLLLATAVAGVVAFLELGRAEDPSFTIKQMTFVAAWPGATAKEMEAREERRFSKRIEKAGQVSKSLPAQPTTAGTIAPNNTELVRHWTVSPKLANSGNPLKKRYNPDALRGLMLASSRAFKFVASSALK